MKLCNECGEQEAMFHGVCEDCRDMMFDEVFNTPPDDHSLCDCEDRPCCGCDQ